MGNKQGNIDEELKQKIYNKADDKFAMKDTNKNTKYEFTICSFNIWCPYWNDSNGVEANYPNKWKKRNNDILKLISHDKNNGDKGNNNDEKKENDGNNDEELSTDTGINADIYCIQEFWCDNKEFVNLYHEYLKNKNYKIIYLT